VHNGANIGCPIDIPRQSLSAGVKSLDKVIRKVIAIFEQQVILVSSEVVHELVQNGNNVVVEADRRVRSVPRIPVSLLVLEEWFHRNFAKINGVLERETLMAPWRDRVDTCRLYSSIATKSIFGAVDFNARMIDSKAYKISTP
jgi:hypothetical protein